MTFLETPFEMSQEFCAISDHMATRDFYRVSCSNLTYAQQLHWLPPAGDSNLSRP